MSALRAAPACAALALAACVIDIGRDDARVYSPFVEQPAEIEDRAHEPFTSVRVEGALNVELAVGTAAQRVRIQGDRDLLVLVTSEVRDGMLLLSFPPGSGTFEHGPLAIVECPELAKLTAAGSGWVAVSGLGEERLGVELAGSGDVLLRGSVKALEARIDGTGQLDVAGLEAATIATSGARADHLRGAPNAAPR